MKPRERLIENIVDIIHARKGDDNSDNLVRLLEATLKTHYAIGRWVSVEERLPEFDEFGVWEGYARLNNEIKSVEAGQWDELLLGHTTHWLETDISEVGE